MKSYRQLNHTLDMLAEMTARWPVARDRERDVFEHLMSVEEVGAVEQIKASVEVLLVGR